MVNKTGNVTRSTMTEFHPQDVVIFIFGFSPPGQQFCSLWPGPFLISLFSLFGIGMNWRPIIFEGIPQQSYFLHLFDFAAGPGHRNVFPKLKLFHLHDQLLSLNRRTKSISLSLSWKFYSKQYSLYELNAERPQ